MEPLTMASATLAFNALKRGFQVGRDIESMASDLSRWMSALSDVEQAEKESRNPPLFKKLFNNKSVEQEAIEAFANKRQAQAQRDELKSWIEFTISRQAWQDLLATEADIRKRRKDTLYKQREKRRKFMEIVAWSVMLGLGAAALYGMISILMTQQAKADEPKMTTCRLAAQERVGKSGLLCFYIGANNTQESHSSEVYMGCQRQYKCKYDPRPKGMSLKDTLKSIKDALE